MFYTNQILKDTYQILKPIGDGGTSLVYLGYHLRLQKNVVIKQLRGSFKEDFLMRTEVDILKNIHHPNLPQVYDFIHEQDSIYSVIDFVDGYDLEAYIKAGSRIPEQLLKRYLRQIAEVLDYLHGQNPPVIHSDIKPGNVIIDMRGNAILIDFNTSIGGNQGNLIGLTLPYASPEQIQLAQYLMYGQEANFSLDGRSDLYSLGATFYELISGIRPTPGVVPKPLHTMGITEYSRDFLMVIDRLIEYDRNKRIKSAKKLLLAVDRLDSRYWVYFGLRCASIILSATLIAGGIYCCIRGARRASLELFQSQYNSAVALVSQGYLEHAENTCDEIFGNSEMQAYLQDNPLQLAKLYHTMGDIYYYQYDYGTSAVYYRYAVELGLASDSADTALYARDAAVAYAQYGDLTSAEGMLETAQNSNANTEDIQLIAVVIEARKGNIQKCLETAQQLIRTSSRTEICMRAALTAASVAQDIDTRIAWLEVANSYDGGKTVLRGLAIAYVEKSQSLAAGTEKTQALQKALSIYQQLCDSVYASSIDIINYSVALRQNGNTQDAISILRRVLEIDPVNYRVHANLCFAYYESGDYTQASVYCESALRLWRNSTSVDRLSESSEEIQNLLEIGRRFGIGGT